MFPCVSKHARHHHYAHQNIIYFLYIDTTKRILRNINYHFYRRLTYTTFIMLVSIFLASFTSTILLILTKIIFLSIQMYFLYNYVMPFILDFIKEKN